MLIQKLVVVVHIHDTPQLGMEIRDVHLIKQQESTMREMYDFERALCHQREPPYTRMCIVIVAPLAT